MLDFTVRFLAWVLRLCTPPPRGRHRLGIRTSPLAAPPPSHTERLDGAASALVRPYVLTHDERHRQRERRRTLYLATLGVDVGPHPHLIHGGAR
ncbi:hypothetical protein [Streptomyces sp. NPDC056721]|uniref:hypothetical protein n=1 Tax=unclassified Streptomyces TaxID=2593676 RepID=UPI0036AE9EFF